MFLSKRSIFTYSQTTTVRTIILKAFSCSLKEFQVAANCCAKNSRSALSAPLSTSTEIGNVITFDYHHLSDSDDKSYRNPNWSMRVQNTRILNEFFNRCSASSISRQPTWKLFEQIDLLPNDHPERLKMLSLRDLNEWKNYFCNSKNKYYCTNVVSKKCI